MYEILKNRSVIEIIGEDALNFLQNLTTNDLNNNSYCYSYMLSNQGRYLFDFFVFNKSKTHFLIDIDSQQLAEFKIKLMLYKLRAKVQILEASDNYKILYSSFQPMVEMIASQKDPRYHLLGFRSIIASSNIPPASELTSGLYLENKYELAIPDGHTDLVYDRSIPLEYGAEELNAVSYTKGCYIGQEVISRTKYQGVIRKKIFKITANKSLANIEKGAEITIDGINIGVFCSGYQNQAIGLIREEKYLPLKEEIATISGIDIQLLSPPWR